jgi:hypothetical protein
VCNKNQSITPRLLRPQDAAKYLGMNKNQFNKLARPFLTEIKHGERSIAFDRYQLDQLIEDLKRIARPPQKTMENESWQDERKASPKGGTSGTSTKPSKEKEFSKALVQTDLKRRKVLREKSRRDTRSRTLWTTTRTSVHRSSDKISQRREQEEPLARRRFAQNDHALHRKPHAGPSPRGVSATLHQPPEKEWNQSFDYQSRSSDCKTNTQSCCQILARRFWTHVVSRSTTTANVSGRWSQSICHQPGGGTKADTRATSASSCVGEIRTEYWLQECGDVSVEVE